jgi:hypothetical protein
MLVFAATCGHVLQPVALWPCMVQLEARRHHSVVHEIAHCMAVIDIRFWRQFDNQVMSYGTKQFAVNADWRPQAIQHAGEDVLGTSASPTAGP